MLGIDVCLATKDVDVVRGTAAGGSCSGGGELGEVWVFASCKAAEVLGLPFQHKGKKI